MKGFIFCPLLVISELARFLLKSVHTQKMYDHNHNLNSHNFLSNGDRYLKCQLIFKNIDFNMSCSFSFDTFNSFLENGS